AVADLGYAPHAAGRALREARSRTLGLVLSEVTGPMFGDVVSAAQRAALEAGFVLVTIDAAEVEGATERFRELVSSGRLDGLLLQGGYGPGAAKLAALAESMPAVLVNAVSDNAAPCVVLEDAAATRLATAHLVELGHRRLAFVTGPAGASSSD